MGIAVRRISCDASIGRSGLCSARRSLARHRGIRRAAPHPSRNYRLQFLGALWTWLQPDGRFFISNWQFLGNQRLQARTQPWSAAGLTATDVDPNDYLLDWRHGPIGLRYVHQFDEAELHNLATSSGFHIVETFYADGRNRQSGLYQIWAPAPQLT